MSARNHLPGDTTQKPGPGAYSPEKVSAPNLYRTNKVKVHPRYTVGKLFISSSVSKGLKLMVKYFYAVISFCPKKF